VSDGDQLTYEYLGPDERLQIVESRLRQYEAEHYSHSLNRRALELAVDLPEDEKHAQLRQIDQRLASIERSIELHRDELARTTQG
jgi:hypothetical protein